MRILLTLAISTAIIASGAYFYFSGKNGGSHNIAVGESMSAERQEFLSKDSDNDGLKDWEEELWGTDPFNPDTDKDGTSDFDEVRDGRDPTKAGPNDKMDSDTASKKINPEIEADLSETDKLGRELFAEYIGEKNVGSSPSLANYQEILLKAMERGETEPEKIYGINNLNTSPDKTVAFLKEYGNNVGDILSRTPKEQYEHELFLFQKASETEKADAFDEYDGIIAFYSQARNDLLAMKVPEDASSSHLLLVNSFTAIIDGLKDMRKLLTDPVKAMSGFRLYAAGAENIAKSIKNISAFFNERGISFTQNEGGYLFSSEI
ncbi:MAG: hypothetical protein Q8P86_02680 [bacterium]|nr:hypothetical protein [bacterium]